MSEDLCNGEKFKQYLSEQCIEIQKHKWIESEKAGHDLGNQAVQEWIKAYAKRFRDEYIKKS